MIAPSRPFIHDDFLLRSEPARELYHEYAERMPILDYHCHLPPADVAADRRWENLTQLWLGGDHYKWRAMRSNGVDERLITGDAPDRDKFQAFAETMPYLLRNPMYDWSHLELARYFGILERLTPGTAQAIWDQTRAQLARPECSARGFMRRSRVQLVCTTDDPADSLEHHLRLRAEGGDVRMLPTWRPDKALALDRPDFWNAWLDRLGAAAEMDVRRYDDLLAALARRHAFFASAGCVLADYGIETVPEAEPCTARKLAAIFAKVRGGGMATPAEVAQFRAEMLFECGRMDAAANWTWQIHYGALRNNNTRMHRALGPDTGYDSIGDWPVARAMARLFDRLDAEDALPRTIVYTLNPGDNEVLGTMIGNFQRGPMPGKMQFGSGWWFNDQKDGMRRHLEALSQLGLLSRFVGMLTDSRSFLSYTRHEYFRRLLCDLLGGEIADGQLPNDLPWVGGIVRDICYHNAARYFGFDLGQTA
ncbi:MAG: glucuronate isomerase [Kiritimatiellae bacterium]|nr:glucuronate isomerase [Kiritimatiellia bacterium]